MHIGFALPISGSWATRRNILDLGVYAEALGYQSLWTFQRLLQPADHPWGAVYDSVLDPTVVLAGVAAVTERVRLGLAVLNMPYYAPLLLAKQLTTLDELASGRLDVGLGLGWAREEFAALGVPYNHRGERADEYLRCLVAIWTQDVVEFDGEYYPLPSCRVDPKPVQRPHPPLLLGGSAPASLARAGRVADGWITSIDTDLLRLDGQIGLVRDAAGRHGRDPDLLRFIVRALAVVTDTPPAQRPPLTGSVEQINGDLERLRDQGATEVFFDLNFDPRVGATDADAVWAADHARRTLELLARS